MTAVKGKSKQLLLIILIAQLSFYFTVIFDIPIARQVIGFLYFTFIPGFLIVKLAKLDKFNWITTMLFSVGLSVAFLMIGGLLINEFYFLIGISQPLSLIPLIITFNSFILMAGVFVYLRSEDVKLFNIESLRVHPFALLLVALPILSIVGATWANVYANNSLLLFMILTISLVFIIVVFSKKLLSSKLYPFAILMIAIALLFQVSFISNNIVPYGSDVPVEYFVFKNAESQAYWPSSVSSFSLGFGRINAMLSVTVLPTVYSSLLNMDSAWMFKTIYPLLFCLVPLGLYEMWRKYIGAKYAFISAFLLMAQETFYTEMFGLNRQMIGELFFVLSLLVIFNKEMNRTVKITCFVVFSFGLLTSHYALALILLSFIALTKVALLLTKKFSRSITVGMLVIFLVMLFAWYMFTSGSVVFDSILEFGERIYGQLGDFLDITAREDTVLMGLGLEESPSIYNTISRVFAYATQFLIVVGFVGVLKNRVKTYFEKDYFIFTFIALSFLAALILVPGLSNTMNMTRFYHILLFVLAPLCALGAKTLAQFLPTRKKMLLASILLIIVIVPYFLFQTEFVFEVTESNSWSIPLSEYRMSAVQLYGQYGYVDDYSLYGAQWVSTHVDISHSELHADDPSRSNALTMYGMIYSADVGKLYNVTTIAKGGTVYLSKLNVVYGKVLDGSYSWDLSEVTHVFDGLSLIYSNGGSEIYQNTG